jgi:hypothetical protein
MATIRQMIAAILRALEMKTAVERRVRQYKYRIGNGLFARNSLRRKSRLGNATFRKAFIHLINAYRICPVTRRDIKGRPFWSRVLSVRLNLLQKVAPV